MIVYIKDKEVWMAVEFKCILFQYTSFPTVAVIIELPKRLGFITEFPSRWLQVV